MIILLVIIVGVLANMLIWNKVIHKAVKMLLPDEPLHITPPSWKSGTIPIEGYINGRPYFLDNEGRPIYGYQPRIDPNRALLSPPQGGSVLLDRPLNHALEVIYSKSGKPPYGVQIDEPLPSVINAYLADAKSIGRYYVAEQCYESAPYPTSEHEGLMVIECQVEYE